MNNTANLDIPDGFWKSRAEKAEAECENLRAIIEHITDELHVRADKIIELDSEVRRLGGNTA